MKNSPPPFLETEREKTDRSLTAERDKTNESLTKTREKTENRTDKFVKEERREADQTTSSSRTEADAHRAVERRATKHDAKDERKKSDARLLEERRDADSAVERERFIVDAARDRERDAKKSLIGDLLERERGQTDDNLLAERNQTDSEVHETSTLLSAEIAEHSKTKVSLTTRDEFLAIVSHDLRNPIGAVSSCAEMLLQDSSYNNMNPDLKRWIEFMKRNADSSLRMIADILDMESIAEGKLKLHLESQDIGKIIQDSMESFVLSASTKNVLLRSAPSHISGEIICDRDRITQVLSNLIGNALKFTPEGGSIILKVNLCETEVEISLRDTGPGIPEEKKSKIFERFAQLGSNDRRGLGLGLYISKMLVEAHRGRLWVQSKFGEGSTFFFSFLRS